MESENNLTTGPADPPPVLTAAEDSPKRADLKRFYFDRRDAVVQVDVSSNPGENITVDHKLVRPEYDPASGDSWLERLYQRELQSKFETVVQNKAGEQVSTSDSKAADERIWAEVCKAVRKYRRADGGDPDEWQDVTPATRIRASHKHAAIKNWLKADATYKVVVDTSSGVPMDDEDEPVKVLQIFGDPDAPDLTIEYTIAPMGTKDRDDYSTAISKTANVPGSRFGRWVTRPNIKAAARWFDERIQAISETGVIAHPERGALTFEDAEELGLREKFLEEVSPTFKRLVMNHATGAGEGVAQD